MKAYVLLIENKPFDTAYTSLKELCVVHKLGYSSANHGKRVFILNSLKYEIKEVRVIKIQGRGKHSKGFSKK